MIPESKLIKKEFNFRVMAFTPEVRLSKQSALRFIALSLGLISPKESRQGFFVVLKTLIEAFESSKGITSSEVISFAQKENIDDKTVYYHLKRLEDTGFITKREGEYFIGDGFERNFINAIRQLYNKNLDEMFDSLEKAYSTLKNR